MSDRKQANIDRINQLWGLHEPEDEERKTEGRCLAFAIDRRYIDGPEGVEMRMGVSFGPPVVGPETKQGFLQIPVRTGQFVFGLHLLGTKGNQLTLYDKWMTALDAGGCTDAVQAGEKARAILDGTSDEEYLKLVRDSKEDRRPLKVSSRYLLEDFEVVEGEAW
jgi:hypothetical protein